MLYVKHEAHENL